MAENVEYILKIIDENHANQPLQAICTRRCSMRITFLGAAEMVTGSCYLLEFEKSKILVDCGMFQGGNEAVELNQKQFAFDPSEISHLILTHAHIDHTGRVPQLAKLGFKGKIICTKPTHELCKIMLPDSAFIQEMETEWQNRKRLRAGKKPIEPFYTVADAQESLKFFEAFPYDTMISINNQLSIRFRDAGHILGSAIVEMWVTEGSDSFKIVFSGDLGNKGAAILKDPTLIEEADYVIVESTYGNRFHKDTKYKALALLEIINDTIERNGNVVIPSFAVERTQEILYELNTLKEAKTSKLKSVPVYVDSPLAIHATKIFQSFQEYMDDETLALVQSGDNPFEFANLIFTETADESKAINFTKESSIIISASGMCDAGRIKHHLKHNLWREDSSVVFVGYQAKGTLGRRILDGEKTVKIFGEEINIKCKIFSIEGFSGHADQKGLMEWLGSFKNKPTKVFLVHGEEEALSTFSELIHQELGYENEIARLGQTIELTTGSQIQVVAERYTTQKQTVLSSLEVIKNGFNNTFDRLQKHIQENDSVKLDMLRYMLEKIDDTLQDMEKEIKK